jgi:hypothetical protein
LATWKRKILRKICDSVSDRGIWRVRINQEFYDFYQNVETATDIKLRRLEWLGHLISMENNRIHKILLDAKLEGKKAS